MKQTLLSIGICLIILSLSGCLPSYEYVVDSDYSYLGKFSNYSSFGFINNKNFKGTDLHENIIRAAIKRRMEAQGYTYTDRRPNLLISYSVFYEDFGMRAYDQKDLDRWVEEQLYNEKYGGYGKFKSKAGVFLLPNNENSEGYDPIVCDLKEGSLHIAFFDRRIRRTIWQGYASGFFGNENFNNQRYVSRTVSKILDQYRILAEGFEYKEFQN